MMRTVSVIAYTDTTVSDRTYTSEYTPCAGATRRKAGTVVYGLTDRMGKKLAGRLIAAIGCVDDEGGGRGCINGGGGGGVEYG
jgi:hypothetical protein